MEAVKFKLLGKTIFNITPNKETEAYKGTHATYITLGKDL